MKLYLCSIMEPSNFGPGRIVGIATGNKPLFLNIDFKYNHLIPAQGLLDQYYSDLKINQKLAANNFVNGFRTQLNNFTDKVLKAAKDNKKDPASILPFQDGDTLVSWERKNNTNYRGLIAESLEKLGYDVVKN